MNTRTPSHPARLPAAPLAVSTILRQFLRPEIMLLAVAAIWGSSYAVAKAVNLQVTVLQYLVLRFGLTALVLTPALRSLLRVPRPSRAFVAGVGLGVLLLGVFLCETWGITLTSATHAAFLISVCVAFTPLVEWVFLKQRPSPRILGAVALCMAGTALLSPGAMAQPLANLGDGLMLLAAFLRACMVTATRRSARHAPLPALALTALQAWVVCAGSALALWLAPAGMVSLTWPADPGFWGMLLFLVLFCTVFAFFAQNHAAARSSPTRVSFLMGSEPVFGALFGWLMFKDRLSPAAWLGCGLILAATFWVVRQPGPKR